MSKVDDVLSKLDRVKKIGENEWVASSPTRSDRTPSLYIKENPNGQILLHDFGGSTPEQICSAIGIEMQDLFPDSLNRLTKNPRYRFNAHNVMASMRNEMLIVALCAIDISSGKEITEEDKERVLLASQRLKEVYELCLG